jgi:hypothetical protein
MRQLNTRLATRISAEADRRLRLTALVRGMRLGHLLDQILSQHLPTADQLTAQINAEAKETTSDER